MCKLKRIYQALFALIFSIVMIQVLRVMVQKSPGGAVLFAVGLLLVFLVLPGQLCRLSFDYRRVWIFLQILSIVVMAFEMQKVELQLSWDWGAVIQNAYLLAAGKMDEVNFRYFAVYPNNQFWLACMTEFFKLVLRIWPAFELHECKVASMVLGGILTQGTLLLIYQSARLIMTEKRAFWTGALAVLFLPFYYYAQIAYTDIPGMFGLALMLYLYVRMKKTEHHRALYLVLFGCVGGITYKVKVTTVIFVIALFIEEFLSKKGTKEKWKNFAVCLLLTALPLLGTVKGLDFMLSDTLAISEKMSNELEFPITHWVMMGLAPGSGGYNKTDVEYTHEQPDYEAKKAANIEKIQKRIQEYGAAGLLNHIFGEKLRYGWCKSILSGNYYGTKNPMRKTRTWQLLNVKGKWHWMVQLYSWPYYAMIILGLVLSGFSAFWKKTEESSVFSIGRLTLLGIFLFLSLWECNSRYLVCFLPVMILVSADGLMEGWKLLEKRLGKRQKGKAAQVSAGE
ncbi:MAG: glycosyltransferase family 39 protein [Lachnospiraceae bacterium]|nr:glycosyltransferase family 39 protein [Lachnospiraceae bacterium]